MSWKRLIAASVMTLSLAGLLGALSVAPAFAHSDHASGQWPTSCVDLNDVVEAHLGNTGNVGIYQATFEDQAEAACRNDHREDVRSTFAWAFGLEASSPQWLAGDVGGKIGWSYSVLGNLSFAHYFAHSDTSGDFMAMCNPDDNTGSAALRFPLSRFSAPIGETIVTYPGPDGEYQGAHWSSNAQGLVLTTNPNELFLGLLRAGFAGESGIAIFAVDQLDWRYSVYVSTTGLDSPDHPFIRVLADCGVTLQDWPTTCVQLNDVVETHLGRLGNVGIYQSTFGEQAEQACRNDHLDDVRSVFSWAVG